MEGCCGGWEGLVGEGGVIKLVVEFRDRLCLSSAATNGLYIWEFEDGWVRLCIQSSSCVSISKLFSRSSSFSNQTSSLKHS